MDRFLKPEMTYYKETYKNSKHWNGEDLTHKTIIVYGEQGLGDIIQAARYFPLIPAKEIIVHAPTTLHSILPYPCFDKNDPNLPNHDFHVPSLSLPFILPALPMHRPYLKASKTTELASFDEFEKVGIAWEGNPLFEFNSTRSCPLSFFKNLEKPNRKLFMIQNQIHQQPDCELELYSIPLNNMKDTAELIQAMDFIVSVDTAVLHLAGALGKKCYGLLSCEHDYRWNVSNWYQNMTLIKQKSLDWVWTDDMKKKLCYT